MNYANPMNMTTRVGGSVNVSQVGSQPLPSQAVDNGNPLPNLH